MYFAAIQREDPNNIFMVVKNGSTVDLTTGLCVHWDLNPANADTLFLNQIRTPYSASTLNPFGHAAGVVAGRSILGGDFGTIQVFGYHPGLLVTGNSTLGVGTRFQTAFDSASITDAVLMPANCLTNTTNAGTPGYFGIITTGGTNTILANGIYYGGYAQPIEQAAGTFTFTSTGRVKAFVKFLS